MPEAIELEGNPYVQFEDGTVIECQTTTEAEALAEAWRQWPFSPHPPVEESRNQWRTGFAAGAEWRAAQPHDSDSKTAAGLAGSGVAQQDAAGHATPEDERPARNVGLAPHPQPGSTHLHDSESSAALDPFPIYCIRDDTKWAWGHHHGGDVFAPRPEFAQSPDAYRDLNTGSQARPQKTDPAIYAGKPHDSESHHVVCTTVATSPRQSHDSESEANG